jgi:hypothetical protein
MGFFRKTRLLFSGMNGRIEANILNAFDLLEKGVSKKKLVKFHKKNPIPLFSFAYNIATEVWLQTRPFSEDSNLKIILVVTTILTENGFKSNIDLKNSEDDEDMGLGEFGRRYMTNVFKENKPLYLEAIRDTVVVIKQKVNWW